MERHRRVRPVRTGRRRERDGDQGAGMTSMARQQPSRGTAIFEEAAFAFNLPRDATFAELAEELGALGERYGGRPLYVDVRLPA